MNHLKRFAISLMTLALLFFASGLLNALGTANADTSNIIANSSFETANSSNPNQPDQWSEGNWGTNKSTFSYLNTGHTGSHSAEVQMSSYSSGDAKWYFNPVNVNGGTEYNFSDYYESSVTTDVVVQFADASGNNSYVDLGAAPASTNWQAYNAEILVPSSAVNVTVFHLINSVGYLITDDYSLTLNTAPIVSITSPTSNMTVTGNTTLSASANASDGIANVQFQLDGQNIGSPITTAPYQLSWDSTSSANGSHYATAIATGTDGVKTISPATTIVVSNANPTTGNIIPNPQLNTANSNNASMPQDWQSSSWGTNAVNFSYLNSGYNDTHSISVQMTSYTSGDAKWFFSPQLISQDTQYRYSEYYKSTVQTQVMAVFNMANGTTVYQYIGLPDTANNWTNFTTTFSIPLGTVNMTVYHLINQVGSLTTDDFSMTPYTPTGFKRPLVTLTFDDGYASTYKYGLPLVRQYGYSSTQFIITNLVGQRGYVTKANIKTMYNEGQEIASHTITHSDLTQENVATMTSELSQSQSTLMSIIGKPVTDLAYPYGLYNTNILNASAKYYQGARSVEDGLNSMDNFNKYDIKVQNVFLNTPTTQIADWVKQAQQTNTWLVLVYHSVDPNTSSSIDGDEYNVTPTELSNDLAAIKASGIQVETMQTALTEVESQL